MRVHLLSLAAVATLAAAPGHASAQTGLGSLFSCASAGSQNETGAVIGGLAGALVGSQVSKNERGLGAVVGAGLGAVAGNYIGCRMQTSAQAKAKSAFQTALDTGRTQNWNDPRSGASGRIEVIDRGGYGGAPSAGAYGSAVAFEDLRWSRGVERQRVRFEPADAAYRAASRVNLRAGPSTSTPVVGQLQAGETFDVAGQTRSGWLAVERDGWVQGYVSASVVRPAGGGYANAAYGSDCRTVRQTINVRGYAPTVERYSACRGQAGEWQVTKL